MQKKKKTLSEITIIPPHISKEAGQFMPRHEIQNLSFWKKMSASKQELLREEIKQLAAARMMHFSSGLAMGKHIKTIYDTCEPYSGAFRKLMSNFSFVVRTAYRYMDTYENARKEWPENILKAAINRGMNIVSYNKEFPFGKYTEVSRLLTPPTNPSIDEANRYLDQLEQTYKDRKKVLAENREKHAHVVHSRKELLKMNYRGIRNALKSIPAKQRRPFLDELFGMALTELGISGKTTFSPEAIPEDFRQGPGRPSHGKPEAA